MKDKLIELWCKATKERELEEFTEDIRKLHDYTMEIVEENEILKQAIKDTIASYLGQINEKSRSDKE